MATEYLVPNGNDGGWDVSDHTKINNGGVAPGSSGSPGDTSAVSETTDPVVLNLDLTDSAITDADTVEDVEVFVRARTTGAGTDNFLVDLIVGGTAQGTQYASPTLGATFVDYTATGGWTTDFSAAQLDGMQVRLTTGQAGKSAVHGIEVSEVEVRITYTAASLDYTASGSVGYVNAVGFSPSHQLTQFISAPANWFGAVNAEGFAATVTQGGENLVEVTSLLGEVNAEGFAATASVIYQPTVFPLLGQVNVEGFAASAAVVYEPTFTAQLGEVRAEGFAPTATVQNEQTYSPTAGNTNAEGFAPTVTIARTAIGAVGEINVEGFSADVAAEGQTVVTSLLGQANAKGFQATVAIQTPAVDVTASLGEANAEGFQATVTTQTPAVDVTASLGEANAEGFAPTVTTERTVTAQLGVVNAEGFVETVTVTRRVTPTTGEANAEGFAPTTAVTRAAIIRFPDKGEVNAVGFSPQVGLVGRPVEAAEESSAGSGFWDELDAQIRRDDELIIQFIREFLDKVA